MALPSTVRIERSNPAAFIAGQFLFVARLLVLIASLIAGIILHNLWRLFRQHSPWPRLFLLSLSWTSGIATATTGKTQNRAGPAPQPLTAGSG